MAWCRTAFGAYVLAVGLGGASLVSKTASSAYGVLGIIFALVGCLAAGLGTWQYLVLLEYLDAYEVKGLEEVQLSAATLNSSQVQDLTVGI